MIPTTITVSQSSLLSLFISTREELNIDVEVDIDVDVTNTIIQQQLQQQQQLRRRCKHHKHLYCTPSLTIVNILLSCCYLLVVDYGLKTCTTLSSISAFVIINNQNRNNVQYRQKQQRQWKIGTIQQSLLLDHSVTSLYATAKKGFGTSKSENNNSKKKEKSNVQQNTINTKLLNKDETKLYQTKLIQQYGGITSQDIAIGTQQRINTMIQMESIEIQIALQLYTKIIQWDIQYSRLSLVEQISLSSSSNQNYIEIIQAKEQLNNIYNNSNSTITESVLHTILQRITWDASADAKAIRSITGTMPVQIQQRIQNVCTIISNLKDQNNNNNNANSLSTTSSSSSTNSTILDVGCGYGVMVPFLINYCNFQSHQIYGIDLSKEMIRNANEIHCKNNNKRKQNKNDIGPTFIADDFYSNFTFPHTTDKNSNNINGNNQQQQQQLFDFILFSSSLHDLPDMYKAIEKASTLLLHHHQNHDQNNEETSQENMKQQQYGYIIIVHTQGSEHVQKQHVANPILVKRTLPNNAELYDWCNQFNLIVHTLPYPEGYSNNSIDNPDYGYLAILRTK